MVVRYSNHSLNDRPFDDQTVLDYLNTELVRYSDSHFTFITLANWVEKLLLRCTIIMAGCIPRVECIY